jgi:hypothetical protein
MKADVPRPPQLRIPAWVPKQVAERARELARAEPPLASPAMLRALATDKRMKWVWRELSKHCGDGYLHPARPLKRSVADPQGFAMELLFSHTLTIMRDAPYKLSISGGRREAEEARDKYATTAWNLRSLAQTFVEVLPPHHPEYETWRRLTSDDVRKLKDAAEVLEQLADLEHETALTLPERDRGNAQVRGVTGELVKACRIFFGRSLYGVVARIASVVLETNISERTVRAWHPRR